MAHNVTYADLRFVKAPVGNSTSSRSLEAAPAAEEDAELTYENILLAQTLEVEGRQGVEPSKEPWWSVWYLPLSLLGACLVLLASTVGLGVRYWQVSQHLQQVTRAHEAESIRFSQQVSATGASLAQTTRDLEQARRDLEQAREQLEQTGQERNSTQEQLRQLEAEFTRTEETRQKVEEENGEIKEKLRQAESALSSIRTCDVSDPAQWLLYEGRCLFISQEEKTWEESKQDCEQKSAQLLIVKTWEWRKMPNFLRNSNVQYWIGFKKDTFKSRSWQWVDGSPFNTV
ncbi:B-cell differentiation antigen CD72 isoform X2 [Carettochelys insculpta]|uniref:B-cell differentiation antigen CD72 isoform X2 n=1 Tax=Carettochelys insculpta TaxID=44489 RepID=UPI003EC12414